MYQVGTWQLDWSPAGPGNPPRLLLVRIDCLRLNWTHDHEHGSLIATAIAAIDDSRTEVRIDENEPVGAVEFAPEQLVARVPAEWADDFSGTLSVALPAMLPASLVTDEEVQLPVQMGRYDGPGFG